MIGVIVLFVALKIICERFHRNEKRGKLMQKRNLELQYCCFTLEVNGAHEIREGKVYLPLFFV